jgi:hypothetical protein
MPYCGIYRGPDAFMDHIACIFGTVSGGTNFKVLFQIVNPYGSRICTVVHLGGKIRPKPTPSETYVNEIWEFRDGLAVSERNWYGTRQSSPRPLRRGLTLPDTSREGTSECCGPTGRTSPGGSLRIWRLYRT